MPPEMRGEILGYLRDDTATLRIASLIQKSWEIPSRLVDCFGVWLDEEKRPEGLKELADNSSKEFKERVWEVVGKGVKEEGGTLTGWIDELSVSIGDFKNVSRITIWAGATAIEARRLGGLNRWKDVKISAVRNVTTLSLQGVRIVGLSELIYVVAALENLEVLEVKHLGWAEAVGDVLRGDVKKISTTKPPAKLTALNVVLLTPAAMEDIGLWLGMWKSGLQDLTKLRVRTKVSCAKDGSGLLARLGGKIESLTIPMTNISGTKTLGTFIVRSEFATRVQLVGSFEPESFEIHDEGKDVPRRIHNLPERYSRDGARWHEEMEAGYTVARGVDGNGLVTGVLGRTCRCDGTTRREVGGDTVGEVM